MYYKGWRNEDAIFKDNCMDGFFFGWYLYKKFWVQGSLLHISEEVTLHSLLSFHGFGHSGGPGCWLQDLDWEHLLVLSVGQSCRIDVVFYSVPSFETSCKTFNGLKSLALIKYHLTQINRTDEWSQRNSIFTWLLIDSEVEKYEQGTSKVRGQLR